jgi:UDP-perosamine 4-acetyltransferase
MKQRRLPVVIVGGGGHAKVVADVLRLQGVHVLGFTDIDSAKKDLSHAVPYLGDDSAIQQYRPEEILLANGVGSTHTMMPRRIICDRFTQLGYRFFTLIHPSAIIATDVVIGEGSQIMAGAVIQPGSTIGRDTVVNTGAIIDHDCVIGDYVHVAPGVVLSGGVTIKNETHIGTGARVIQGILIGKNCLIAAGAVVVSDVADGKAVKGIPARGECR